MAAPEILIDTDSIRLLYHPDGKIVHHELRRFSFGAPLRAMMERGVQVMEQKQARKWLSDDRGNGPFKAEDSEWINGVWAPRALAAGFAYWAVIMPQGTLGKMNMRRWVEQAGLQGVTVELFEDAEAALKWMRTRD